MELGDAIFLLQVSATWFMVGLIWFVQIVHYPLFDRVGAEKFAQYEASHQQRTTRVVAPVMLIEAITAALLFVVRPHYVAPAIVIFGGVMLVVVWMSTFFVQVPDHERLRTAFQGDVHHRLVATNWTRTFAWSARGILWIVTLYAAIGSST